MTFVYRVYIVGRSSRLDGSLRSVRRASNLSISRAGGGEGGGSTSDDPTASGSRATGQAGGGGPSLSGRNGSAQLGDPEASMGDDVHPGPIFLRHVVNRRFPYRWLILALSAISCMTIIVVVSVVYSNR